MAFSYVQTTAIPSTSPVARKPSPSRVRSGVVIGEKTIQASSRNCRQQSLVINGASRREAMACMTAALLAPFILTDSAEARTSRQGENRRKIREKLDELREKAVIPKQKTEPDAGDKEKLLSPFSSLTPPVPRVEANLQ